MNLKSAVKPTDFFCFCFCVCFLFFLFPFFSTDDDPDVDFSGILNVMQGGLDRVGLGKFGKIGTFGVFRLEAKIRFS